MMRGTWTEPVRAPNTIATDEDDTGRGTVVGRLRATGSRYAWHRATRSLIDNETITNANDIWRTDFASAFDILVLLYAINRSPPTGTTKSGQLFKGGVFHIA